MHVSHIRERALGALRGLALGDALGMPTQSMSPGEIRAAYGCVTGLRDAVDNQPIAPGMRAGTVTDDTEQALVMGRLLVEGGGRIDPHRLATALLEWEDDMRARGSLDLLGPSTKYALEQVRAGADPRTTGHSGTTNGAAMRVTPVGVAVRVSDPVELAQAVHSSCMVTHDTVQGFEAAMLVASAVSAAIDGARAREAVAQSLRTVRELSDAGQVPGHWSPRASVLGRAGSALAEAGSLHGEELSDYLRTHVGTSVESSESVPCALVLATAYADDPFAGLCAAANLGGDTDTIAAMAGAILGAASPAALPADAVAQVCERSHLDLEPLCDDLLRLRNSRA